MEQISLNRSKEDLVKVINLQGETFKKLHTTIRNKNKEIRELNKEIVSLKIIIKHLRKKIKDYEVILKN